MRFTASTKGKAYCAKIYETRRLVWFGVVLTKFFAGADGVEALGAIATEAVTLYAPAERPREWDSPARHLSS